MGASVRSLGRGYDSTYGFLVGGEDHYTQDASWSVNCSVKSRDLSRGNVTHGLAPCFGETGTSGPHSAGDYEHCEYPLHVCRFHPWRARSPCKSLT
jgi:hypothetical protein